MFIFKQPISAEIFRKKYCLNEKDIDVETVFKNIAREIASVEKADKRLEIENAFYDMMISEKFIPAGRMLANARPFSKMKQYNNCFTISINDSMEEIYDAIRNHAIILKGGGGVGFNISNLRPKGASLSTGGESSGVISFLKVFNTSGEVIHSAGSRRGASIAILNIDHPDIEEFITIKQGENNKELTQFNISVGITAEFIKALKEDKDWDLKWGGKVFKTVKAKYLYELLAHNSFIHSEPGVLNLDNINKEANSYYLYQIKQCNP
jgi:ribonucleoside-diphosphate reductase alpha chain